MQDLIFSVNLRGDPKCGCEYGYSIHQIRVFGYAN